MSSRRQELVAEYALLDLYDDLRVSAGHDYGAGQRVAELRRRRRLLEERGAFELVHTSDLWLELDPQELVDAFARVGRRRLERARRQPRGDGTPRTITTWERVESMIARRASADARLEEARA